MRVDGSPKPAYHALHDLIRGQWWLPPTRAIADHDGRVVVQGMRGDYQAAVSGVTVPFTINGHSDELEITITLPGV